MNNASTAVELLVSVRSVAEARSALEGGAGLIDIKEPSRGALGRADDAVIRDIAAYVAGRRPVSAALGECLEETGSIPDGDLTYVKWGLAGCRRRPDWRTRLEKRLRRQQNPQLVLTAYADSECVQAPPIEDVFALARDHPGSVMLVDTHCKEANNTIKKARPTLLDWLPLPWIEDLVTRCRASRVRIALAGSLGLAEIRALLPARPDWIAVRGAVCSGSDRHATVEADRVHRVVELLQAHHAGAPSCVNG